MGRAEERFRLRRCGTKETAKAGAVDDEWELRPDTPHRGSQLLFLGSFTQLAIVPVAVYG
jgi:hypothetical protein